MYDALQGPGIQTRLKRTLSHRGLSINTKLCISYDVTSALPGSRSVHMVPWNVLPALSSIPPSVPISTIPQVCHKTISGLGCHISCSLEFTGDLQIANFKLSPGFYPAQPFYRILLSLTWHLHVTPTSAGRVLPCFLMSWTAPFDSLSLVHLLQHHCSIPGLSLFC